jgi:hypothetical protein
MLAQPLLLPFRFENQVVSENERTEVFLRDQFCLGFKEAPARADLLIKRNANGIRSWISKIVD